MDRGERAVNIRSATGCNCCQAVVLAFSDIAGQDELTLRKMAAAFGGGMGTGEATCGALCGAQMVLGLVRSDGGRVGQARTLVSAFRDRCGATVCRELKGALTGKMLCSCEDCVRNAADILQGLLEE